jgi:hypothetical protein
MTNTLASQYINFYSGITVYNNKSSTHWKSQILCQRESVMKRKPECKWQPMGLGEHMQVEAGFKQTCREVLPIFPLQDFK